MSKYDIYLQENSHVLKNKLGITNEQEHSGTKTDDLKPSKYEKYYTKDYTPTPHEYVEDTE